MAAPSTPESLCRARHSPSVVTCPWGPPLQPLLSPGPPRVRFSTSLGPSEDKFMEFSFQSALVLLPLNLFISQRPHSLRGEVTSSTCLLGERNSTHRGFLLFFLNWNIWVYVVNKSPHTLKYVTLRFLNVRASFYQLVVHHANQDVNFNTCYHLIHRLIQNLCVFPLNPS